MKTLQMLAARNVKDAERGSCGGVEPASPITRTLNLTVLAERGGVGKEEAANYSRSFGVDSVRAQNNAEEDARGEIDKMQHSSSKEGRGAECAGSRDSDLTR